MLRITNLYAAIDGKDLLEGLSLTGHAIMGPDGAGKSTLGRTEGDA